MNIYKNIKSFFLNNKGFSLIFLLAFILRFLYFIFILHNFGSEGFYLSSNGDAVGYFNLAKQILNRGTFQNLGGLIYPEVFRTPGYPIFIAFFYSIFKSIIPVIVTQNILFIILGTYFYKFVAELLKNKKIALIASGLLLLEPSILYWNNQLITETLFTCALFFAVYFAFKFYNKLKYYDIAISGFTLSIALFIRPAGEYLAIIFIFFYLSLFFKKITFKKIILSLLIFIITFLAPLSSLMLRNKLFFNSYSISNSSTIAFGKYLTAMKYKLNEKEDIFEEKNPMERSMTVKKTTIAYIAKHPIIFVKIYLTSLIPFFFGDSYISVFGMIFPKLESMRVVTDWKGDARELFTFLSGHRGIEALVFFIGKVVWSVLALLAFLGLYFFIKKQKRVWPQILFLILLVVYFSLASGIGSYSRFRFPVTPYIFIFTSLSVYYIFKKNKKEI